MTAHSVANGFGLRSVGFAASEIMQAELATGRMLVPVLMDTTLAYFAVDTGACQPVELSLAFAEDRNLLVLGERLSAVRVPGQPPVRVAEATCPPFSVWGRRVEGAQVPALDLPRYSSMESSWQSGSVAGSLGVQFFSRGVLGLDFAAAQVAYTESPNEMDDKLPLLFELPFSISGGAVFLESIFDLVTDSPLRVYFDSGVHTSALAYDTLYARTPRQGLADLFFSWMLRWRFRRNVRKKERRIPWVFRFGTHEQRLGIWLVSSLRPQASHSSQVDGWLGNDIAAGRILVLNFQKRHARFYSPSL